MTFFQSLHLYNLRKKKMFMSLKDKIMNIVITHPKIVTFSIGLVVTFAIGLAIGMVDHEAFARQSINQHNHANQS